MRSVIITNGEGVTVDHIHASHMATALARAVIKAKDMLHNQRPRLYLRDALGGLRAEVFQTAPTEDPNRKIMVRRTK